MWLSALLSDILNLFSLIPVDGVVDPEYVLWVHGILYPHEHSLVHVKVLE